MLEVRNPPININYRDPKMSSNTALHMACANGHLKIASLLLSCNGSEKEGPIIDFNVQNDSGNTALHYAALNGHKEIV